MEPSIDELRRADDRWRVDVDVKLNRLIRFADENESFIHMLREREGERQKLRHAVIEKSLSGIVWAVVIFIGLAIWDWIRAHLK